MLKLQLLYYFLKLSAFIPISDGARILAVFPIPVFSHRSVFRPLIRELATRGHEVVIIKTYPSPEKDAPNLTEIDTHDVSLEVRNNFPVKITGKSNDIYDQVDQYYDMFRHLVDVQINTTEVKDLISDKNQYFDLILLEGVVKPALVFTHLFKAPAITISSLGSIEVFTKYLGVPVHPILYPTCLYQKLNNLTLWEKAREIYTHIMLERSQQISESLDNEMLKKHFGSDVPPLSELQKNVAMLMINVHRVWEDNRPVPPNVVYLGGLHLASNYTNILPTDLQSYLDSSTQGVIYVSFGSLVMPSLLENMKIIIQSLSKLPYNIVLKWDDEFMLGCPKNVKVVKWIPQRKLLQHPNIKLFIMQGGLQSIDEAIEAGVPLIGIPFLGDQWYNVEKFEHFGIGLRINFDAITEKKMLHAINTVINDINYKRNVVALKHLIYDQPQSSMDRAIWWIEYILRHGLKPHLKPPAAHMSSWEFFEINLILVSVLCLILISLFATCLALKLFKAFNINASRKVKRH